MATLVCAAMGIQIREWFGFDITDWSQDAKDHRDGERCPFIGADCTKVFSDRTVSGVCAISSGDGRPVAICPNRLYAENHAFLADIAATAFGPDCRIIHPRDLRRVRHDGKHVVAFGKRYGSEVRLPQRRGTGNYFVDWILARISAAGTLAEFVAVEVQTIDTTGTYRPAVETLRLGQPRLSLESSTAGFNWENVSKRILPQLIYKGQEAAPPQAEG